MTAVPASADTEQAVQRRAGDTRITTAVAVSQATFASADTALLARADTYPDALTGTVLAHQRRAPLLLTERDRAPEAVTAELQRLGVERVVLLGGTAAISNQVRDQLAADHRVSRVGGSSRWATAVEVAEAVDPSPETVVLATGEQFPDAVAVSAYAAHQGWPVLLTARGHLPQDVTDHLDALGPVRVVPVGGSAAISPGVLAELEADGHTVSDRLAGPTRWATSHRIATAHADALGTPTELWLATGQAFPDALTAGVAAAANGALLQLTPTDTLDLPGSTRDVLARLEHQSACDGSGSLTDVVLVGGIAALTDTVRFHAWTSVTCTEPPAGTLAWTDDGDLWLAEAGGVDARSIRTGVAGATLLSPTLDHAVVASADMRITFVDLATGATTQEALAYPGAWSPDGTRFAFSSYKDGDTEAGVNHIAVANADGSDARLLPETNRGESWVEGWSADGREVVYFRSYDDAGAPQPVYATNVDTGRTRLVSEPGPDRHYFGFSLSPDRTRMAVIEHDFWDDSAVDTLFVIDMATGERTPLLDRTDMDTSTWSPDGTELAVTTEDGPVRVDVATGTVTPISRGQRVVSWSPDGSHLLVAEDDPAGPGWRAVAVPVDGGAPAVLTPSYQLLSAPPAWSPDGQWIVYSIGGQVHQVSVNGHQQFQLTSDGGMYPVWEAAG